MAKRNEIAKKSVDLDNGSVTFAFADAGEDITVSLSKVPEANQNRLALHGLSQKCGDSYAGAESVAEARESVLGVQEMLYSGEWSTRAPGEPRTAVLAEALSRAQGITIEEAKKGLEAIDAADKLLPETDKNKGAVRKALNAHPAIRM